MGFWEDWPKSVGRKRGQTLLGIALACVLLLCLELYVGNIQRNQEALAQAGRELPVEVKVVSADGSQDVGIRIEERKVEGLLAAGVKSPAYTVQIAGNIDPVNQVEPVKACDTSLYGVNALEGFSFGEEDSFIFAPGYDGSFVESQEPLCVLSARYAAAHGLQVGDSMELPVYSIDYDQMGYSFQFGALGTVSLQVIGTFEETAGGQSTVNGIVPIAWVRALFQDNNREFSYHSFRGLVENPLELNTFKAAVEKLGFREVNSSNTDPRTGNALEMQDKVFRETAERLQRNIRIFQWFAPVFCVLLCVLVFVTTFFSLRSSRKEFAIASSLGTPLAISGAKLFLENLLLTFIGCGIALMISAAVFGMGALAVGGVFLMVSLLGSLGAVLLVCRFDVLETLTKQEETL